MEKLDHALALARAGFRVFPLYNGTKFPAVQSWQTVATTDEEMIRAWWSGTYKTTTKSGKQRIITKDANIGICTTGLVVLDVDTKDGHEAEAKQSLEWVLQHQPPRTMVNMTPTGGCHLVFKSPAADDIIRNQVDWVPRVDIRGYNGFIVGPGSTVPAGEYHLQDPSVGVSECPPNLMESILNLKSQSATTSNDFGEFKEDYGKLPDRVTAGERDDTLFRYVSSWRQRGLNKEQALIMLGELFKRIDQPAGDVFTWDAAVAKLEHVWDSYKPGGENDPAKLVEPTVEVAPILTRERADLQTAIDHFIYIEAGRRVADTRRHPTVAVMTLDEFKTTMKPDRNDGSELVTVWLRSPHRQTVRDVGYFPQDDLPVFSKNGASYYNAYYGPSLTVPEEPSMETLEPMLGHIRYIYNDPRWYELFLDWAAFTVQYPHVRVPWCYLTVSLKEGVGKGLIYSLMAKVLGEHNCSLVQPDELSEKGGTYNGYLSHKTLVWWDEIKAKAVDYERLRLLITSPQLMINHKYGSKKMEDIYANTGAFSNHLDAIRISASDRRFFVHCLYDNPQSAAYYDRLWRSLDGDLPAHWLAMLKSRDVSVFRWSSAPPMTSAKVTMQQAGVSTVDGILLDAIEEGLGPFACDIVDVNIAREYVERVGVNFGVDMSRVPLRRIANLLTSIKPPLPNDRYTIPTPPDSQLPSRVRCKCIRNYHQWSKRSPDAISAEYARARIVSTKGVTPERALVEVKELIGG